MKRLLWLLLAVPAFAQSPVIGGSVQYVTTAPSGACVASPPVKVLFSSGVIYTCNNGIWAASGGGGGPTFAYPTGTGLVRVAGGSAWGTTAELSGDVTTSGSNAATIANSAVTLAKIANASANSKLLGSGASGSGAAYSELTLGTGLSMSGTTLNSTASSTITAPTFKGFTTSGTVGAGSVSSVTTGAATYAANDLVVCFVRTNTSGRTFTWTSSPANTWNTTTVQGAGQASQMAWAIVGAGSTTVTATYNSADTFGAVVCMDYSGTLTTKNGDVEGTATSAVPFVANLATTGRTLNIFCVSIASTSGTFGLPAGVGNYSYRAADSGSAGSNQPSGASTIGCFDSVTLFNYKMTGVTTYSSSLQWTATLAAFDF